ncbi:MAG: hypothetical protein EOO46_10680 [Flavobacterium sp.]|nr:MAG: hypothetical protein EOO46_10680 [Flavobacterium sp.]
MKLRKCLLAIMLLITTTIVAAQDYKKVIEAEFSEYLTAIETRNFEKSTDYILPGIFDGN